MRSTLRYTGAWAAAAIAVALLSGCATSWQLDNTVQSFSAPPAVQTPASYRFDRLPSQQAPGQEQLEAMADPALRKAGFQRNDASPRYGVQLTARLQPVLSPWADPWDGWAWGGFGFHRRAGFGFGVSHRFNSLDSTWYRREAGVVVRELSTGKVVYETRAVNDGPWSNNADVFPAMFEAALQGFPNPPPGPRQVNITVQPPPKG
jgi:hypothetical protein